MKKIKFIAPLVATSALAMSVLPMVSCEDDPVPVDTTADVYAVNINKSTHSDITITQSTDDVTVGENLDIKIDFVGLAQTTYYSWVTYISIGKNVYYQATNRNPNGFTFLDPDKENQLHISLPGRLITKADVPVTIIMDIQVLESTNYICNKAIDLEVITEQHYDCMSTIDFDAEEDEWVSFVFPISLWENTYGETIDGDVYLFLFDLNEGETEYGRVLIPYANRFGDFYCGQIPLEKSLNTDTGKLTISKPVGGWPKNSYITGKYQIYTDGGLEGISFLFGEPHQ